jgi:hypothetical protein
VGNDRRDEAGDGLGFDFFTHTWCFGSGQGMARAILRHTGPSAHARGYSVR